MTVIQHRYCVITPYHKEERALLDRCIASVRRQSPKVDHILVADGFPQNWIDAEPVRHIKLDRAHGDYGNAARGLGALMAIAEGYRGIAFLDADNWYDDDHIAACLTEAEGTAEPAYVVAQRRFCRPDGSTMMGSPADVPHSPHVDTNCFLFLPAAFPVLHRWCTMPNALSAYGDQLFGKILRAAALPSVLVPRRTVNYLCLSETIYQTLGEAPPPGSKPQVRWAEAQAWIYALTGAGVRHLERMTGLTLGEIDPADRGTGADAPAAPPRLSVEVPGSPQPAVIRRTDADIATYKQVFVENRYGAAALPERAGLVVDLAAGIGLSALWLHRRYPDATVVALEPDPAAFEILAENLAGRDGCRAIQAALAVPPHTEAEAGNATPPGASLAELLHHIGDSPIDLLRVSPDQWQGMEASQGFGLDQVRAVLVEGLAGLELVALSDPAPALDADPVVSLVAA